MKHRRQILFLFAASLLLLLLTASPASGAPEGACYLNPTANAIRDALANPFCVQINLNPGVYKEHGLTADRDIVLRGSGMDTTIIDGMGADQIFNFSSKDATVIISDVTIRNGKNLSDYGGAIFAAGKLFVRSVRFVNNFANDCGAICALGPVTSIQYSTFTGNLAADLGGAILILDGQATVDVCTFEGNSAGYGGAIYTTNSIPLDVTNSTFKNNQASGAAGSGYGGAIRARGPTNIIYSSFTGNQAYRSGGALAVAGDGPTYIRYSSLTKNQAGEMGGAISQEQSSENLNVYFDTLKGNISPVGGGIASIGGEHLVISYSALIANKAQPILLRIKDAASAPVKQDRSERPRLPVRGAKGTAEPRGGGVYAEIPSIYLNSTFSGNKTTGNGGGIYAATSAALSFVTFAGNKAAVGGSIYSEESDPKWVALHNTLFDNGKPENCASANAASFSSQGGNLSSDHSCDTWLTLPSDKKGVNPLLGKMKNNGGPTKTRALLAGSPAIHGAANCQDIFGTNVTTDQRQFARSTPLGAPCDIGAYEAQ